MFMNRLRLSTTRYPSIPSRQCVSILPLNRLLCVAGRLGLALVFTLALTSESVVAQPPAADEAKPNNSKLPDDYIPPPEKLAIMDLDQPIADKEEMARLKKESATFARVKQTCDVSSAGKKVVEAYIRYKLAEMTLRDEKEEKEGKDRWSKLPLLHRRFIENEIASVGGATKRAPEIEQMTRLIGDTVVKQMPELLKNNFYIRVHAVQILAEMDYGPASALLLQLIQTKDISEDPVDGQPEAIKIEATLGLLRMVRFPIANAKERTAIAQTLVAQLQNPEIFWWRQLRYIDILRYCDIPGIELGNNDRPFVVESLVSVARDKKRPMRVRTHACYALGRVPLPRSAKVDDIVNAIMECTLDLCNAAIAKPKDHNLKRCFADIYFAFQTANGAKDKDLDTEKKGPGGLLVRAPTPAKPAYAIFAPIFADAFQKIGAAAGPYIDKVPSNENMKKLNDFVRARQQNMQQANQ